MATKTTTTKAESSRLETRLRSFFGLSKLPFAKGLEPDQLFMTDTHARALERLAYLVDRRGIGAIFGTPGCGKSTLIRSFLATLGKSSHAVCYVNHTNCASVDLHREIARGFQLQARYRKADVMGDIKARIIKLSHVQKLRAVLVIDEAHLLPSSRLDELRLLTSFDTDSRDELTLVLAGHPQLESNLRLAVNEALAQRLILRVHLRPLRSEEVDAYLRFRLELAGRTARLFLPDAAEAIYRASRGIPRLVDSLAEHSLLIALKAKKPDVNADIVTEAIDEVDP
jgi:type II secretory pathway predicted ATPase ExeA